MLQLARRRRPGKSLCPSEVARALRPNNWRALMPLARQVAFDLADEGCLVITQRGQRVDRAARGPIRIALTPSAADLPK